MVDRTEALVLQMSADIRKMERALNQARGQTNRQLSAVEKRFDQMNAHVRRSGDEMARDLRASIASIGIGLAIREVTNYADVWTTAQNRLAAAGVAQGDLAATMSDLVNLARETRSEFGGTVELYAKLTRAGQQLNLTQAEVRKITETTLQAFVAGGAAASEQAAAVTQLSQALGSGVLQGDELRSIRENAPLLAEAIAKEFNTTIAGLKELGAEGELTADRVARAILNADGIFESFERTVSTVEQAMTNLRTEFTRYIAESRIAQTAIQALGGFIQLVTDNIDLFADAAIVAAAVIGGTLAVGAIARLIRSLTTTIATIRTAETAMKALSLSSTFLFGPIGAAVLGIGAAFAALALSTGESASAAERAAEAFANAEKIQSKITSTQAELEKAQKALTRAIEEGGLAAQAASAKEVDRLRKSLEGSKALLDVEKARAAIAVRDRQRDFATKGVTSPFGGAPTLQQMMTRDLLPALRGQSPKQFITEMSIKAQTQALSDQERKLFDAAEMVVRYEDELAALQQRLKELNEIQVGGITSSPEAIPFPEISDSRGGQSRVRGYQTDLERLKDTLDALGEEAAEDAKLIEQAVASVNSLLATDQTAEGFSEQWRQANDQLGQLYERNAERVLERSREAVQALLDLANNDLPAAFAQVPNVADILTGEDEGLLMTELTALAQAAADAVAVGFDRAVLDHQERMAEIARARAAAIAAGIADLSQFERAAAEADAELTRAYEDLTQVDNPYDIEALSQEMRGFVDDIEWEVAGEELRQVMRESVKNAMREGIRTGDWGDAFAMVLADAVTAGLDDALNRIGDFLADQLFGDNGLFSNIANAASNWLFSPRASGGAVMAGQGYRINDRGDGGEFLFMGSNPGQVLRQHEVAGLLGNSRGGAVSIVTNVTLNGSDDRMRAEFQQVLNERDRRIMTAVPSVVNATLIDNRTQKRRF